MSTEEQNDDIQAEESTPTYGRTAFLNAFALGVFAIGTALILGLTYTGTKDRIAESQRIAEEKALLEVIGDTAFDNDLLTDLISLAPSQIDTLNLADDARARVVRLGDEVQGFIFPAVAPDGYSGNIYLLIGLSVEGTLTGVRVVEHRETPGLGDKVDTQKSDWILSFAGKSLQSPEPDNWAVKKDGGDFDAFTGATITPRAVVSMVKNLLDISKADMDSLVKTALQAQVNKTRKNTTQDTVDG